MKLSKLIIGFTAVVTPLMSTLAEGWDLSLGVNYRTFDGVEFKSRQITNGGFLDGSVTWIDDNGDGLQNDGDLWLYKVASSLQQVDVATLQEVTYTQAAISQQNADIDDGIGVVFKASYTLRHEEKYRFNLDLSLTTARSSSKFALNTSVNTVGYDIGENWNDPNAPTGGGPLPNQLDKITGGNVEMGTVQDGNGVVYSSAGLDFDLYTLGLGISGMYDVDDFSLFIGAGPTISLIDYEMYDEVTGYWKDGSGTFYSSQESEHSTKWRGGLYAEFGLLYAINETWGIGVAGRYDYIPVKVETEVAEIDLTGFSGQAFINYQF